jgi:VIT1/CCC1 family predicted Fe2+/Mn2+ transporter
MNMHGWHWQRQLLPIVLGLSDGVLTALILATGRLVDPGRHIPMNMALRISASAFATGAFVFFVARYSQLRAELVVAERQLNLTSHGRLASSKLGRAIFSEAIVAASLSSLSSFVGAMIPLSVAALVPAHGWAALAAALVTLALLGAGLAKVCFGRPLYWSSTLVAGGVVLSILGAQLRIV